MAFKLSILSPHGKAFEGECDSLTAPGLEGDFGVLTGHAPMLAMLRRGIAKISASGSTTYFVVGEGVCEVSRDGVNVLVDTADKAASLDEAKAGLAQHLVTTGAK